MRLLSSDKFDFDDAIRHLSKGQPIIIWRCWSKVRDDTLSAFAKELKAKPDTKLPSARDAAEKKKWPMDSSGSNAITSMIVGFNRQRGEVILSIPYWGPDYTNFRMRKEEMETCGYAFWFFEPK